MKMPSAIRATVLVFAALTGVTLSSCVRISCEDALWAGFRPIVVREAGRAAPPAGVTLPAGTSYNKFFPGHVILMPPPLSDKQVEYTDGAPMTTEQYSKDVSAFLMWAAEPHLDARKRIGFQVMIFLVVLAGLAVALVIQHLPGGGGHEQALRRGIAAVLRIVRRREPDFDVVERAAAGEQQRPLARTRAPVIVWRQAGRGGAAKPRCSACKCR